ncbi:hypothetical protein V2J09_020750 [Rumex salicifolius]
MEMKADVVIVGAGIAGLSTALGLHRLGVESLVLECWEDLRVTGFGFTAWSNAWKALDILGIGDPLRLHSLKQQQLIVSSTISGKLSSKVPLVSSRKRVLVETMANELPKGSIRFSSKKPHAVGKSAIRGFVRTPVEPCIMQFMGDKIKYGIAPITANSLYWYLSFIPSQYNGKL